MRHLLTGIVVAMLAGLVLTSSASAITIYDVKTDSWSAAGGDPYDWSNGGKYGLSGYSLMWTNIDAVTGKFLAGRPTGHYTDNWKPANPAWLIFKTGTPNTGNGTGPYQPSGTLSGTVIPRLYTLESWDKSREFDFSIYFYDPGLTATGSELVASVILTGNFGTHAGPTLLKDPFNFQTLTADQVHAGTMITFDVGAAAGEEVAVTIETKGTYAAGFFLDNVKDWTPPVTTSLSDPPPAVMPEPATMALLALGMGGIVMRRRRR